MRQLVALVKDGTVSYALVDTDTGQFAPFAQIQIADPDRFGLHEAAVLGSNLVQAVGLNGPRPRQPRAVEAVAELSEQPTDTERYQPRETARERRNRVARETYHARKQRDAAGEPKRGPGRPPGTPNSGKPSTAGTERYVSLEEVLEVLKQYPEGITSSDLSERLWRLTDGHGGQRPLPRWFRRGVENRVNAALENYKNRGEPLPFALDYRARLNKAGQPSKQMVRHLVPVGPLGADSG